MADVRLLRCGRCNVELGAFAGERVHKVIRDHAKTCGKPRTLFPVQGRRTFVAYSDREIFALDATRTQKTREADADARKGAKGVTINRDGTKVYHH